MLAFFLNLFRRFFENFKPELCFGYGSPLPPQSRNLLICLVLSAFLGSCGVANVQVYHYPRNSDDYPRTVAVLPFTFEKSIAEAESPHIILRREFFNYFSYLGYEDMPLEEVNRRLHKAGHKLHEATTMKARELRNVLGVDAVIRGHVLGANNFTGGIYAETRIQAHIKMVDLRKNQVMWETVHSEVDNTSILALTVVDTIQDQIDNTVVPTAFAKVAESFTMKVLEEVPDPAELRGADVRLPKIHAIQANISVGKTLKPDDIVRVMITGDPGLDATFDIGNWKLSIPMTEKEPGHYEGFCKIQAQDNVGKPLIVASLKNKNGLIGKKFFKFKEVIGEPGLTTVTSNEKPAHIL